MSHAADPRSGLPFEDPAGFRTVWLEGDLARRPSASIVSGVGPLDPALSARSGLSIAQMIALLLIVAGLAVWTLQSPMSLLRTTLLSLWLCFVATAGLRLFCSVIKRDRTISDDDLTLDEDKLPTYSVIIALYREAAVIRQLLTALHALNYPPERLDIILALEADDKDTLNAIKTFGLPDHMQVLIVPDGTPRTKPRALNHALQFARGDYVVIYDAEDIPHPDQLREAASRFSKADPRMACLQAPLRPLGEDHFISRQFSAEYAVQFEVILPAFNALGLPLPLGGTSNHFRIDVLKSIGGWDAWNVTEDADLGMRMGRLGYDCGMLGRPTFESPPTSTEAWIPQRTRWIKGYIQTLFVHTRQFPMPLKLWFSLFMGVGLSAFTALAYAPFTLMVTAQLMTSSLRHAPVAMSIATLDLSLFIGGTIVGMIALNEGARRSQTPFELKDMLMAPLYWGLTSIAAIFAVVQLMTRPFHWDKTEHQPLSTSISTDAMKAR